GPSIFIDLQGGVRVPAGGEVHGQFPLDSLSPAGGRGLETRFGAGNRLRELAARLLHRRNGARRAVQDRQRGQRRPDGSAGQCHEPLTRDGNLPNSMFPITSPERTLRAGEVSAYFGGVASASFTFGASTPCSFSVDTVFVFRSTTRMRWALVSAT